MYCNDISKSKIADDPDMPSRPIIVKWAKEGHPHSLTKGLSWDEFKKARSAAVVAKYREARVARNQDENLDMIESMREDVKNVLEGLVGKLSAGDFEAKPADLEKLITLYMKLDNDAADKITWMNHVASQLIQAAAEVVTDDRLRDLMRLKFIEIMEKERDRMGVIPNAIKHIDIGRQLDTTSRIPVTTFVDVTETEDE